MNFSILFPKYWLYFPILFWHISHKFICKSIQLFNDLKCFTLVGFIRNSNILLTVFRINIKLYLQWQHEQKPCWPNHCPKITPRLIKLFWIFDYHLSQIIMIIIFTLFQKIVIQIFFVNSTLETLDSCVVIIIIYVIVWSIQIFLIQCKW